MKILNTTLLSSLLLAGLASSCSITRVDSHEGPPRIQARGVVEGHAAVGILAENDLLNIEIFDGTSQGSFFEFRLWKLLRLELGFAGASASVGPLHVGVGVLSYEPIVPRMTSSKDSEEDSCSDESDACCDQGHCEEVDCEEIEEEIEAAEEEIEEAIEEVEGILVGAGPE